MHTYIQDKKANKRENELITQSLRQIGSTKSNRKFVIIIIKASVNSKNANKDI